MTNKVTYFVYYDNQRIEQIEDSVNPMLVLKRMIKKYPNCLQLELLWTSKKGDFSIKFSPFIK
jgi:hypothetical protein